MNCFSICSHPSSSISIATVITNPSLNGKPNLFLSKFKFSRFTCCSSSSQSSSSGDSFDSVPVRDNSSSNFCIIEGPETVQDFAQMQAQEIQDNIRSRRNKIFLLMEEPISRSAAFSSFSGNQIQFSKSWLLSSSHRSLVVPVRSSAGKTDVVSGDNEGVSLGTMKLPVDTDVPRFETLLFQWANSLCQGAQLPLPVPLKVDKIEGGVRLGFVTIDDGKTEVEVYIDCQIFTPGANQTGPPIFVATRNGPLKNKVPAGEPRIMKSLLAALKKSVEIARV